MRRRLRFGNLKRFLYRKLRSPDVEEVVEELELPYQVVETADGRVVRIIEIIATSPDGKMFVRDARGRILVIKPRRRP